MKIEKAGSDKERSTTMMWKNVKAWSFPEVNTAHQSTLCWAKMARPCHYSALLSHQMRSTLCRWANHDKADGGALYAPEAPKLGDKSFPGGSLRGTSQRPPEPTLWAT